MARKRTTPLREETLDAGHGSQTLRRRILGAAHYFRELRPETLDWINDRFREEHFPAEAVICREGADGPDPLPGFPGAVTTRHDSPALVIGAVGGRCVVLTARTFIQ